MPEKSFYENGIRFECSGCGNCCTGAPGYVWITEKDIESMARFLGIREREFLKRYTRKARGRISLIELPDYDCSFFNRKKGCSIYDVRPPQCRTYPFWPEFLKNKQLFKDGTCECSGIDKGRLWTCEEIKAQAAKVPMGVFPPA